MKLSLLLGCPGAWGAVGSNFSSLVLGEVPVCRRSSVEVPQDNKTTKVRTEGSFLSAILLPLYHWSYIL